jgi:hypothetical protein
MAVVHNLGYLKGAPWKPPCHSRLASQCISVQEMMRQQTIQKRILDGYTIEFFVFSFISFALAGSLGFILTNINRAVMKTTNRRR